MTTTPLASLPVPPPLPTLSLTIACEIESMPMEWEAIPSALFHHWTMPVFYRMDALFFGGFMAAAYEFSLN